eukprot:g1880.t1
MEQENNETSIYVVGEASAQFGEHEKENQARGITITRVLRTVSVVEVKERQSFTRTSDEEAERILQLYKTRLWRLSPTSFPGFCTTLLSLIHFTFDLIESVLFRGSATTIFFIVMILMVGIAMPIVMLVSNVHVRIYEAFRRSMGASDEERETVLSILRKYGARPTASFVKGNIVGICLTETLFWGSLWLDGTIRKELEWGTSGIIFLTVHAVSTVGQMILFNFVYDSMMGLLVTPMMRMMALGRMFVRDLKYVAKEVDMSLWKGKLAGSQTEDRILLAYRYLRHELDEFNRVHGHLFALMLVPMVIGLFVLSYVMTDPAIPRYFHGFFLFMGTETRDDHDDDDDDDDDGNMALDKSRELEFTRKIDFSSKEEGWIQVHFTLWPYILETRSTFGTSHSSTSSRENALLRLRVTDSGSPKCVSCFSEVGLPPKRAHVYMADFTDVTSYCKAFFSAVDAVLSSPPWQTEHGTGTEEEPREGLATFESLFLGLECLQPLRVALESGLPSMWRHTFSALLQVLDGLVAENEKEYGSVGHALFESVLLLAIADKMETSIMHLVGVSKAAGTIYGSSPTAKHRSFYTVGLTDEMSEALSSAAFGRQHTPNVKIKLDGNIDRSREILDHLDKVHAPGGCWCVDANCSWTPDIAMRMAEVLGAYRDRLFMIEQPFPVEMPMDQDGGPSAEEWKNVRESLGWKIYADESFRTAADVAPLRPYVHG